MDLSNEYKELKHVVTSKRHLAVTENILFFDDLVKSNNLQLPLSNMEAFSNFEDRLNDKKDKFAADLV